MKGKVTMFSDYRGYGFIRGDNGRDYFVHQSMILGEEGFRSLSKGDRVSFEPIETLRGWQAWRVMLSESKNASEPASASFRLKANPFTPQEPVIDPRKFAGRETTLANAIDCLFNNKNVLVTGARGIGKSSLAYQLVNMTRGDTTLLERIGIDTGGFEFNHITGDHRCLTGNTLHAIAQGLLRSALTRSKGEKRRGSKIARARSADVALIRTSEGPLRSELSDDEIALNFVTSTESIISESINSTTGVCFLIDEVDVLDREVLLAPFLKAVIEKIRMDGYANVCFILSGVTGSTTDLIAQHPSAGRLTETLSLEPMSDEDLSSIIDNALAGTGVSIAIDAKDLIIDLSANFPAPVHLLGYHAFRLNTDRCIDKDDVGSARDFVVQNIKKQDFQGRLDKLGGGVAASILRVLAEEHGGEMSTGSIARILGDHPDRIGGNISNLIQDGLVQRIGKHFEIAEPLFRIYLRWVFGIT